MNSDTLYTDSLVTVTSNAIKFKSYYFPFGDKTVPLSKIRSIATAQPSLRNGRYRIYGSSDFQTWFPPDWKRPQRDTIFFVHFANSARRIGFTVEDSATFEKVLERTHLLRKDD